MAGYGNKENKYRVVSGKEKTIKNPKVVIIKKPRLKHWYNKKIKLWQALLISAAAVWLFWVFWVIGYVGGQVR